MTCTFSTISLGFFPQQQQQQNQRAARQQQRDNVLTGDETIRSGVNRIVPNTNKFSGTIIIIVIIVDIDH